MPSALKTKEDNLKEILKSRGSNDRQVITKKATLCFLFRNNEVLLQLKKEGKFGGGHWNGLGGKAKETETPEQAAIREVFEESGIKIKAMRSVGKLRFVFENDEQYNQEVHVFSSDEFSGHEKPSEEGILRWFEKRSIPLEQMWPADRHWMPLLIQGKRFYGEFYYDSYPSPNIKKFELKEL